MPYEMYEKARKQGEKAYKSAVSKGRYPYLPVLDDILDKESIASDVSLGLVDVPIERIVGTSTAGRTQTFASNFMPLMNRNTEFAYKWDALCTAHLEEGIHDPIKVYEYLNNYYVVEGNKRVSVLKFFGADSIPAFVTRKLPKLTDDPEIKLYYEFMDFSKKTGVNTIWLSHEGDYDRLIKAVSAAKMVDEQSTEATTSEIGTVNDTADGTGAAIRAEAGKIWDDDTILELKAAFRRFESAFNSKNGAILEEITTGDAFLVMVELKGFDSVSEMTVKDMQDAIQSMWQEFLVMNEQYKVEVSLDPPEAKTNVITQLLTSGYSASKPLMVAFLYDRDPAQSDWLYAHELGRNHIKEQFGDKITTFKITTAVTEEDTIAIIDDLVTNQGVEVIFTTTTGMVDASLKCAIKYPNVKILNCSLNTSHRYIRTYYARLYEAKFLSGLVAGALTNTDKIGYIADYPIVGATANINAFALGAAMVNPDVKVFLKWSTLKDIDWSLDIYRSLYQEGIDFISDQDMITPNKASRRFGMYKLTGDDVVNMTMTAYNWGLLYEKIIDIIMKGGWGSTDTGNDAIPINYWWGLNSGVVDIILSQKVPAGVRKLVDKMSKMIIDDQLHIFEGEIKNQNGDLVSHEGEEVPIDEIIKMNYLVENVVGRIPDIEELSDSARPIVEMRGIK